MLNAHESSVFIGTEKVRYRMFQDPRLSGTGSLDSLDPYPRRGWIGWTLEKFLQQRAPLVKGPFFGPVFRAVNTWVSKTIWAGSRSFIPLGGEDFSRSMSGGFSIGTNAPSKVDDNFLCTSQSDSAWVHWISTCTRTVGACMNWKWKMYEFGKPYALPSIFGIG